MRVADIFHEVDEEVRRERLKKIWDRYGAVIVGLALLIVVGVGGWRAYQWWEAQRAAESGAAFEAAVTLAEEGKHAEARAAFDQLAAEGTAGYRLLARFRAAAELAATDKPEAAKAYDALAADGSLGSILQDLARVRAGLLLVDTTGYDDMRNRLEPLSGADRPFRHTARELLALSAWRAGDAEATRRWGEMVTQDPESPAGLRSRIEMLLALAGDSAKS